MALPPQFSMDVLPAVQEAEKKFQAAEQTVKMWETLAPQFQAMGGPMLAGASQQAMEALKTRDEAFMELQKVQASGLAFGAVQQIGFGQGVSIDTTTGLPGEGVDGELGGMEEQKTPLEKLALQTNMLLERVELNTRVPVARVRGGMS